jgi:hypothetical protein
MTRPAAVTEHAVEGGSMLRLGIPLELPSGLLTRPLAGHAAGLASAGLHQLCAPVLDRVERLTAR